MLTFSIIQKSQLEGANRIDAEYYQPEYLALDKELQKYGSQLKNFDELLEKGNSLTGGATPLGANYPHVGIKFLRVQNIMPGYFDFSDIVFVDDKVHSGSLKRSKLLDNDVLLTITGVSYGKANVYKKIFGEANINQHSVRMHFISILIPEYISTFLNSRYGHFQSDRKITGNSRPALAYEEIRSYKIPLISLEDQQKIKDICVSSLGEENKSIEFYDRAEELLLDELGLKDAVFEDELSCIVNFSDIKIANRMDAEYFQTKYELLIKKLESKDVNPLSAFVKDYSTGYTFKSDNYQEEGIPLIRINNIRKGFIDLADTVYLSSADYSLSPKDVAKPGDIVLSMSGTIGMSAVMPSDVVKCSINQRILRFTPKDIDPDLLVLILNSIVGNFQLERIGTGGVQTNISYKDIQNILIPILPKEIQLKIAGLVRKSHEARKKSKELLEEAKMKVEKMIEKGGDS